VGFWDKSLSDTNPKPAGGGDVATACWRGGLPVRRSNPTPNRRYGHGWPLNGENVVLILPTLVHQQVAGEGLDRRRLLRSRSRAADGGNPVPAHLRTRQRALLGSASWPGCRAFLSGRHVQDDPPARRYPARQATAQPKPWQDCVNEAPVRTCWSRQPMSYQKLHHIHGPTHAVT
jgi:hypothetical protein